MGLIVRGLKSGLKESWFDLVWGFFLAMGYGPIWPWFVSFFFFPFFLVVVGGDLVPLLVIFFFGPTVDGFFFFHFFLAVVGGDLFRLLYIFLGLTVDVVADGAENNWVEREREREREEK